MPMSLSNTTPMQGSSNFKLIEKVVNFTKNSNVRLCFCVNIVMNHLSPYCLILLCFSQIHYISNGWALQLFF